MAISIQVVLWTMYTEPLARTGYEPQTLWNLAFVSEKVKSSRRREDLSSPTSTRAGVILESKRGQPESQPLRLYIT
jgi:hypothetical protein